MATTQTRRINVRLDPALYDRLDRFCLGTRRNVTQAVSILLDHSLGQVEASGEAVLFPNPTVKE